MREKIRRENHLGVELPKEVFLDDIALKYGIDMTEADIRNVELIFLSDVELFDRKFKLISQNVENFKSEDFPFNVAFNSRFDTIGLSKNAFLLSLIELYNKGYNRYELDDHKLEILTHIYTRKNFRDDKNQVDAYIKAFTPKQMGEIALGWYNEAKYENDERMFDTKMYEHSNFTHHQMKIIREGLFQGLDVSLYANPEFSVSQMIELKLLLLEDTKRKNDYRDKRFNLEGYNIDILPAFNPKLSPEEIKEFRFSLSKNYKEPDWNYKVLKKIYGSEYKKYWENELEI